MKVFFRESFVRDLRRIEDQDVQRRIRQAVESVEQATATVGDVSQRFKGVKPDQAEKLLESLAAVGVALETAAERGERRTWSLVR